MVTQELSSRRHAIGAERDAHPSFVQDMPPLPPIAGVEPAATNTELSPPGPRRLLDRRLVHKAAAAEVLLLAWSRTGTDQCTFAFELPRGHAANSLAATRRIPLLLGLEVVRQSGIAIAHLTEGIPLDWKILLRSISLEWTTSAPRYERFTPFRGSVDVLLTDRRYRRDSVSGITAEVRLFSDGVRLARGTGDIDFLTPRSYQAVRRGRSGVPELSASSVLIDIERAGVGLRARVGVDTHDPFVFDHDCDHLPGALLAKAAMFAHEILYPETTCASISLQCERFAEFDHAVELNTYRTAGGGSTTVFTQSGEEVAHAICAGD